jgi:hypothetical protein
VGGNAFGDMLSELQNLFLSPSTNLDLHLTTDQFLYTRITMASKTVEIKPFQDQKPGT